MVHVTSFEIGGKLDMEGSRQVLVKLLLFQSGWSGLPKDGSRPSFFPDSKSSILGLSIDISFIWKSGQNFKQLGNEANIYGGPNIQMCLCIEGNSDSQIQTYSVCKKTYYTSKEKRHLP